MKITTLFTAFAVAATLSQGAVAQEMSFFRIGTVLVLAAVGAALLGSNGSVYGGCNVENPAYPATICAERTAFVKAVSEGQRDFEAIAVVTRTGGSPCGTCRQVMHELAPDLRVIIADLDGVIHADTTIGDLLPNSFTPGKLEA